MEPVIFYNVGPVITQAKLMGFCYPENKDKCKHKGCGFVTQYRKCPKCGKEISVDERGDPYKWCGLHIAASYRGTYCKDCWTQGWSTPGVQDTCDQVIKYMPLIDGEPVQCKIAGFRFRFFSDVEVANPSVEIKFALIRVQFAAIAGGHDFVADLEAVDFINCEMTINAQGKKWLAHPSQVRSPVDISKISNKVDVIKQIHRVFE